MMRSELIKPGILRKDIVPCQLRRDRTTDVQLQQPVRGVPRLCRPGFRVEFDPELVIPNRELSLADGAVAAWKGLAGALWKKIEAAR